MIFRFVLDLVTFIPFNEKQYAVILEAKIKATKMIHGQEYRKLAS